MDPKPSKYADSAKAARKQRKQERLASEKVQTQSTLSNEPLPIHPSRPPPLPPANAPSGPRAMEERQNAPGIRSRGPATPTLSQQAARSVHTPWNPNTPLSLRPFLINSQQYYTFDDEEAEGESLIRSQTFPTIEAIHQGLPLPIPNRLSDCLKSVGPSTPGLSTATTPKNSPGQQVVGTVGVSTGPAFQTSLAQNNLPDDLEHSESNDDVIFTPTKAVRRALPEGHNVSFLTEEYPLPSSSHIMPATVALNPPFQVEHPEADQDGLFDPEPYLLDFGKYEGKTLAQVQEIDVTYITWLKDYQVSNRQPGLAEGLAAHAVSEEAKVTREQLRAAAAEYPIIWGKYAGVALKDVPKTYRQWLMDDGSKSRPKVVEMLKLLGHRKKQPITSAIPQWWIPADMKSDAARSFLDDYNREDSLISPFDALRFFGLPKAYYLERLPNSDGNHWLYQVYDLLAACEGKQRAEAALEDFLTHNSDREADGFII